MASTGKATLEFTINLPRTEILVLERIEYNKDIQAATQRGFDRGYLAGMDDRHDEFEALKRVEDLIAGQWRSIPTDVMDLPAIEAFSAGRNWMLDAIREAAKP